MILLGLGAVKGVKNRVVGDPVQEFQRVHQIFVPISVVPGKVERGNISAKVATIFVSSDAFSMSISF